MTRSPGTRPPAKASTTTTSAYPSRSSAIPRRPSTGRTLMPLRGGSGSSSRTRSVTSTAGSRTICGERGREAATYRGSVIAAPPTCTTRTGAPAGAQASSRSAIRRTYSNSRRSGWRRSTCDWFIPSSRSTNVPGPSPGTISQVVTRSASHPRGQLGLGVLLGRSMPSVTQSVMLRGRQRLDRLLVLVAGLVVLVLVDDRLERVVGEVGVVERLGDAVGDLLVDRRCRPSSPSWMLSESSSTDGRPPSPPQPVAKTATWR